MFHRRMLRPTRKLVTPQTRRRSFFASLEQLEDRRVMDATYHNLAGGNFSQDWTNAALIALDDNWSGVPSIVGFRGDGLAGATAVDPQTIVAPDVPGVVDVNANQTTPDTFTTGGVTEFAITNPVVALQGSGTARAPYLLLHMNTTGRSNVVLTFNARDIDGSTDNAVQPIAVLYRVGETGNYINLPAGFIADASTGPSLATQVTPISVTLPPAAENQAMVQLRIVTTDAVGSDEWIGIDDIAVTSLAAGPNTPPTVSDVVNQTTRSFEPTAAIPFTVGDAQTAPGSLTVTATSNNQSVVPDANITLGGSGANRTIIVRPGAATGTATITITVTDGGGLTATDTFTINVTAAPTLSIPKTITGNPNDAIQIPILLDTHGPTSIGIEGIDLAITYDTNVLTINSVVLGSALGPPLVGWQVGDNHNDPGKISIGVFGFNPVSSGINGQIAVINATIKSAAPGGASPINLVKNLTVNGSPIVTQINEEAILLGPNPTAASNDPVSDGVVTVGGVANQPPVNTAPAGPVLGTEDINVTFTGGNAISVTDPDAGQTLTTVVSVPSTSVGTFTANNGGGTATVTPSNGGATMTIVGTQANVNLALATLVFVPAANRNTPADGVTTITVATNDGTVTDTDTFNVTLVETNDVPVVGADTLPAVNEDAPVIVIPFATLLANDSPGPTNESSQTITITAVSSPVGGTVVINGTNVEFTPAANFNGTASFSYTITDNGTNGGMPAPLPGSGTASITVNAVNDPPTFTAANPAAVNEDSGIATLASWATFSPGPANESSQTVLNYTVSNVSNPSLFSAAPSVATNGTLTFTPASNQFGTSTFDVTVTDNGGGTATSTVQTFTITVNSVNDAPVIAVGPNQTVPFNSPPQTVPGFATVTSVGPTNENGQTVTYAITGNTNTTLITAISIAANGTLTYTPAAGQQGTATITVVGTDSGGTANGGVADSAPVQFTITVSPPTANIPPTINTITDVTINEDAGLQIVNFSGVTAGGAETQALTVTAISNNLALIPNPSVTYTSPQTTGSLSFTPVANQNGTSTITVTVRDAGIDGIPGNADDGITNTTFLVTVNAVNDQPSFTAASPAAVNEDSGPQSVSGFVSAFNPGPNESGQAVLSYNVSNVSNPSLFSAAPSVAANGTLTYTPAANAFGTSTFDLTVRDNGGTTNGGIDTSTTQTFTITVNPVNDAPTISVAGNQTVSFNAPPQTVPGFASVISVGPTNEAGQTVTYAITGNTNSTLIPTISIAANGTLTYTPAPGQQGTATITVVGTDSGGTANGGVAASAPVQFTITVNPPATNTPPTINAIGNVNINEDAGLQTVNFSGVSDGGDTPAQGVTITVSSSNPTLIPTPSLTYTSPQTTGSLSFTPAANSSGTSTISVTVRDSGLDLIPGNADDGSTTINFTVTVNSVNDQPSFTATSPAAVNEDAGAQSVSGFITSFNPGANEAGQTVLSYNVSNVSNPALFSSPPSVASNGTLTYTPAANAFGTSTFDLTVTDDGGTANGGIATSTVQTFTITVNPVNDQPTFTATSPAAVNEDAGAQTVNGFVSAFNPGPNESGQAVLSYNVSNISNAALFSSPPSVAPNGTLTYTPAANTSGTSTFDLTVTDNGGTANGGIATSTVQTFTITVNSVNDAPTFTATSPAAVNEDAGAQTVSGFVTSFNPGVNESGQTVVSYNVSNVSNPSLFSAAPSVATNGTLTYTAAPNAFGSSTFDLTVTDNGGTANGGIATSTVQTFTITVNPVNDAPSFTVGPNQTVPNTAGTQIIPNWATGISVGPANEVGQTVTFNITGNTNASVLSGAPSVASNGTLTFTPAPGASGTTTITLVAQDSGGTANGGVNTSASQSFTITVVANNPPTINAVGNLSINENAGPQTVNLSGITAGGETQALSVTASSSNPVLIPTPSVSYSSPSTTGTLTFTSAPNQTGTSTITVTVRDAGFDATLGTGDDGITTTTFTVTVNAVNDPPVANDSTIAAVINTPVNGTLSATDPDGPTLTFAITAPPVLGTITSFNPATGAFTYTPNPGATGLDTFGFSVSDGQFTDTGIVRVAIQGTQPVVTPSGGDLLIIGTPDPDMIIVTFVAPGLVRVRTDVATATYPVSTSLIINSGESGDYVIVSGVAVPTTIDLAGGDDYASSGNQDDLIIGGAGNDQINGSGGTNVIWGDAVGEQDLPAGGADVLSSLGGNDTLYGGGGADQLYSGAGDDYNNAGQGADVVSSGAGDDRIIGGLGDDYVFGDEGNDVIVGGGGSDTISGRSGNDVLIGGVGADSLNGDDGSDLLFGNNTSNSSSSTAGDANDLALMAMLATWNASRPAGLANSVSLGNDGSPDALLGYTGDDDFYVSTGDTTGDFGLPGMGTDRFFTI